MFSHCTQIPGHGDAHDLLGEVNVVRLQAILLARYFATCTPNLLRLERGLVSLKNRVLIAVDIVDPEVIVIRSRENVPAPTSA